jgi:hypothetical protein
MKFQPKEKEILLVITAVLGLVDFFTLPFYSVLVTAVFAIVLYSLTESLFLLALVFLSPILISLVNKLLGIKDGFMNANVNPNEIADRLSKMKKNYSQGENLNPETPTKPQPFVDEYFTDLLEVSKRVENINNNNKQPKINDVSAIVDRTLPIGPMYQGLTGTPAFMEQFENLGTDVHTNTRIYTPNESSVPAMETLEQYPILHPAMNKLDTDSVNTALMRTTTSNNTTFKGIDMNASLV